MQEIVMYLFISKYNALIGNELKEGSLYIYLLNNIESYSHYYN